MIARIWSGWTTPGNADAYQDLIAGTILPRTAARNIAGYRGAYFLRRDDGDEVQFTTIMLFDSLDSIRAFAGEDYETAYVPPAAAALLARFDPRSVHHETILTPPG